ncbi:hypothetical protein [Streptomyces sp. NPDC001194]|uniref:hypothetical protein n=1 Tax=Streptomyces sp. NPDC001194 TaxID=3364547 RepID=UPI00367A8320
MNESPNCLVCRRELWEDELGRYACKPCERRLDDHLRSLAGPRGLYARLCLRMEPGARGSGPRVSGSADAPIAGNLDVLDLTSDGGIVSTLEQWVEDWSTYGLGVQGTPGRLQHRVDQAIATLRRNLAQAVLRHPALDAFASEIYLIRRRCETHVDGERVASFKATCTCGTTIRFAVDTPGITCRGCETSYGLEEIRQLAVDQRAAA